MERNVNCWLIYNFKNGKLRVTKKRRRLSPAEVDLRISFKLKSEEYVTPTLEKEIVIPPAKMSEITAVFV